MASRTIYVWLEPQTIDVCQQSENVWVASGDFGHTPIRCEGASEIEAVRRWVKIARTSDDPTFDEGGDIAKSVEVEVSPHPPSHREPSGIMNSPSHVRRRKRR